MSQPLTLTDGSVSRGLFRFTLPILYVNVLGSLNGSINSVWVGHYLGETALTATASVNAVMFLLLGAANGITLAASILLGRHFGSNNVAAVKKLVGTGTTLFAVGSICIAATGWIVSEPLLVTMKTPAEATDQAVVYMRLIVLGLPFLYLYGFVMSVLNAVGDSRTPFYFMLLSVALDASLNPLFIFGLGGLPRLGIAGSALATVVAQVISFSAMIDRLYRQQHSLCLRRDELNLLQVDFSVLKTLLHKGIPMSAQVLVNSLSALLMITLANRYGVDTTAAFGASLQLWNYIQLPALAVGLGVTTMAAQNVGARKWERVNRIARVGILYSVVATGSVVLLIEFFHMHLFSLFVPTGSHALPLAIHINRIASCSFIFLGASTVLFGVVRASGAVIVPLVINTVMFLFVRFLLARILLEAWHADAIWWSLPISSALALILAIAYYKCGEWRCASRV